MADYSEDFGNQQISIQNNTQGVYESSQANQQQQQTNQVEPLGVKDYEEKVIDKASEGAIQTATEQFSKTWIEKYLCCLDFLKKYFNITSKDFYMRFFHSLIPFNSRFQPLIEKNPDLYGPFWIYTTLILAIASAGSVVKFIQGSSTKNFYQKFIPIAASIIYGIGFILPVILGVIMRCFGSETTIVHIICTYGYSFSIFIPVVILCVIPFELVQWLLLGYAAFSSTSILCVNYWKELGQFVENRRYILIVIVLICQIGLFLLFKLYFFQKFTEELSGEKK